MFVDGTLEQYMGAYGLGAGAALNLLLADGSLDMTPPLVGEPDFKRRAANIAKEADKVIEWMIDRDQALADMTLAEDTAEMVRSTWASFGDEVAAEEQVSQLTQLERMTASQASYAAGHQRYKEEQLGAEMTDDLPPELRIMPKDDSPVQPTPSVGLAIQFV